MMIVFHHITVLREEAVEGLHIRPDGIYVDCTLGGAGHSRLIGEHLSAEGMLIGLDQDPRALSAAKERLSGLDCQIRLVKSNFRHLSQVIHQLGVTQVDGILFDLGVSSPQLDEAERGFSYHHTAELDMRMDPDSPLTAFEIVNEWSEEEIARILWEYGEEKFARRIARKIIEARRKQPITTTTQLADLIKEAIPAATRRTGPHPARRSFQAIRIAVNDELRAFQEALEQSLDILAIGGRICVITFHSLEDRICKKFFQEQSLACECPPHFPVCVCNRQPKLRIITRKPILPSEEEIENNPRSRSAKLRIAEKI
jgi:16S rRNA (cytosine1402-N4)-methyltransferase